MLDSILINTLPSILTLLVMQHMLDHMLTIHVRSRVFPTMEDAAQFVKAIVTLYDVYAESKVQHQLQVQSHMVSLMPIRAVGR